MFRLHPLPRAIGDKGKAQRNGQDERQSKAMEGRRINKIKFRANGQTQTVDINTTATQSQLIVIQIG
jgi:hypothetical protein